MLRLNALAHNRQARQAGVQQRVCICRLAACPHDGGQLAGAALVKLRLQSLPQPQQQRGKQRRILARSRSQMARAAEGV